MKNVVRMLLQSALPLLGSAVLLYSCDDDSGAAAAVNEETLMTEQSENLSVIMSENGRRSYFFKTPLLEGYTLAHDPYREFRKGIDITTYQDDSMSTVNANLVANYAIYYENRKLWEAKGDVVVIKADGTELYTQQLFWNSMTKRIYSNVDTKIVKGTDVFFGEGFESDEELKQWKFRRMTGRMFVKMVPGEESDEEGMTEESEGETIEDKETADNAESQNDKPVEKAEKASEAAPSAGGLRRNAGRNNAAKPGEAGLKPSRERLSIAEPATELDDDGGEESAARRPARMRQLRQTDESKE